MSGRPSDVFLLTFLEATDHLRVLMLKGVGGSQGRDEVGPSLSMSV